MDFHILSYIIASTGGDGRKYSVENSQHVYCRRERPATEDLGGEHRDHDRDPPRGGLLPPALLEAGEASFRILEDLLYLRDRVPPPRQPVEQEAADLPLHGAPLLDRLHTVVDHPLQHPEEGEAVRDLLRVLQLVPHGGRVDALRGHLVVRLRE